MRPPMFRCRLTLLSAAVAAVIAGGMVAPDGARAEERRTEERRTQERRTEERRTETAGQPGAADERAAALGAALGYVRDLAEWRLRREVAPGPVAGLERGLDVAVALVTVRPADALSAALAPEPPVLTTRPVPGGTNSPFGVRKNPFRHRGRERHSGIDLAASRGTPVHAAGAGQVVRARRLSGYGRVVYIDHGGGLETRYAHLQAILVAEGEFVPAGGLVGRVGSSGRATGPHLHFEVRKDGRAMAPGDILGVLLAPPGDAGWLDRLVDAREEPEPEAPRRRKHHHRRHQHHRHGDHALRSQRPSS
jgi:murein DD-endopeptidase MepM/ murein hydrolase activator NlpD